MNKHFYIIALLLVGFWCESFGQQKIWTLDECISTAISNNIEVKMKQLDIARSKKEYYNPFLDLIPSVNLSGYHRYDFGSTIDPATNGRVRSDILYDNFYLNARVEVLDFNTIATARKKKIDIEKSKADKAVFEIEYTLEVLSQYYSALYTQELDHLQKNQLENTYQTVERVQKEVQLGKRAKSDLNDILLDYSQEEKRVLETGQLLYLQKLELFQLLNRTDIDPHAVVLQSATTLANIDDSSTVDADNPYVKSAQLAFESSKKAIAVQRAEGMPSVSAYYTMSSFYYNPLNNDQIQVDPFSTQIKDNKNQQVGLQLSIPVFNRFKNKRKVDALKIEGDKSKLNVENETLKIQKLVAQEKVKKEQYTALKDKLAETVAFAETTFKTTESKFNRDQIEAVVYTTIKNQWLMAQYNQLKNDLLMQFSSIRLQMLSKGKVNGALK